MRKAIFLDKDGTLIPDIPFNCDPAKITLEANIIDGLHLLSKQGYRLIIVSNQAGVGLNYFTEAQVDAAMEQLRKLLHQAGIMIHGIYYCPHHPEANNANYKMICNCRKPLPGLLLSAAQHHDVDLRKSWMIGDILNDVEAGNRAGCRSILIDNGNETEWLSGPLRTPAATCNTINDAALYICNNN
ncbi:D-glycero-alpha-D-manno-heptose-1,7-bisphosphate 7-phosphatase [Mucilaginibacter auburnensis]|uniref:D,D-heptose 1,7-bisphosphate phosphatase n=1 Tax=Mucilaginibacter auburnensis TaxID=1457233 RepID=A0A2H9VW43_9SPHI|nr:HAD family hydrolase [Mucilaginibacter auburnensis]PJJ85044.1 D,D-heptose 1,7-bisphosphate phosphatase [Mucilaginibacter auburnensis]